MGAGGGRCAEAGNTKSTFSRNTTAFGGVTEIIPGNILTHHSPWEAKNSLECSVFGHKGKDGLGDRVSCSFLKKS